MKTKKLICYLAAFSIIFSSIPSLFLQAAADTVQSIIPSTSAANTGTYGTVIDSGKCGANVTWSVYDSGTLVISGTGEMDDFLECAAPWYSYNNSITSVIIKNGIKSIGDYAFDYCTNLTSVTIPDGVTAIGDHAFARCSSLTTVTIPDGVTAIGDHAFACCNSLTTVTIPDSVTTIRNFAFYACHNLTTVTIHDGVTFIGEWAFFWCDSLTSITIPNSVSSIGFDAFWLCTHLNDVYYSGTAAQWGEISVSLGNDNLLNAKFHFGDSDPSGDNSTVKSGTYGANLTWVLASEGTLIIRGNGDMEKFAEAPWKEYYPSIKKILIENGVMSISEKAFANCINATSVLIPSTVKSIGRCAFDSCLSLESLSIPESVEYIFTTRFGTHDLHSSPFCNCKKLRDIYFSGTEDAWKKATDGFDFSPITIRFEKADDLSDLFEYRKLSFSEKTLLTDGVAITGYKGTAKDVTVPELIDGYTVVMIDDPAFLNCNWIESITLPPTIEMIKNHSFPVDGALTDVYFKETRAIWEKVQLDNSVKEYLNTQVELHCEIGAYTSVPDRFINVGAPLIYTIYTDDPKSTVVSISLSNQRTVKQLHVIDGEDQPDFRLYNSLPASDYITFVSFKGIGNGVVDITITVKTDGNVRHFYDTVYCYDESLDGLSVLRAENIDEMKWEGDLINDPNETYSGWAAGIIISDFDYYRAEKDGKKGYVFNMNAYNGKYSNGVCDVFDGDGNWINSVQIVPSRIKAFDGVCSLVDNTVTVVSKVATHRVSYKTTRPETKISVFVPDGGYIRITNDMSMSTMCAFYNFLDVISYSGDIVGDLASFVGETENKKTLAKIAPELLVDIWNDTRGELFKDRVEKVTKLYLNNDKRFTMDAYVAMCELLTSYAGMLIETDDWKTFGESLADTAADALLHLNPIGAAFDVYNIVGDVADCAFELECIADSTGSNKGFWIHSDINLEEVKQILKNQGISVDTRGNVAPETILHTYKILANDGEEINLDTDGILNGYEMYEIALIKDGYKVQPDDKVLVSIELSDDLKNKDPLTVLRENDDGTWEKIECRIENGMVLFEVDHFCRFAVGELQKNTSNQTDDPSGNNGNAIDEESTYNPFAIVLIVIAVSLLIIATGVVVVVVVVIKKNKK